MYNPQLRIFAPVDQTTRAKLLVTQETVVVAQKKTRGKVKKTVVAHIVTLTDFRTEVGDTCKRNIYDLCETLRERDVMIAHGHGKTPEHAKKLSATFGSGNLLVYVIAGCSDTDPQYLAVGVTRGCVVAGLDIRGEWSVLTVFDGSFTRAALEYAAHPLHYANTFDALFRWSEYPPKKTLSSVVNKEQFVKVFLPKVWNVRDSILAARTEGREIVYTLETRVYLLLELLFNCGEASKLVFLQWRDC